MMNRLILLVEDNEQVMDGNKRMLERAGFEVVAALTLAAAGARINERKPDLIVLDIMLPDGSGFDFMTDLRKSENAGIPILLLTGLSTKADMLRGLKEGGDDYMKKPYDFEELLVRIETLLRRAARVPENITLGSLRFDVTADVVTLDGVDLLFTQKEFSLLLFLALIVTSGN
jgi:DNA-binding response OmpR family regulator